MTNDSYRHLKNGPDGSRGFSVVVDGSDDVLVTGNLGGDAIVAKLSGTDGSDIWSLSFGGLSPDAGLSVAVDGNGDVLATGIFRGPADFGDGPHIAAGSIDVFLAKYSGFDGSHVWSRSFGGPLLDRGAASVAVDGSGDVFLSGEFSDAVDFGGGPLTSADGTGAFLAKYSGMNGSHVWSRQFGAESAVAALDDDGNIMVAGHFLGTMDLGGVSLGLRERFVGQLRR